MLIYRWWNLGGKAVGELFLCHCLEERVYCICTEAISLLQLNKGFEKANSTKESWYPVSSPTTMLDPQLQYLITVTIFSR